MFEPNKHTGRGDGLLRVPDLPACAWLSQNVCTFGSCAKLSASHAAWPFVVVLSHMASRSSSMLDCQGKTTMSDAAAAAAVPQTPEDSAGCLF